MLKRRARCLAIVLAAGVAVMTPGRSDAADLLKTMDTTAPKYNTPECQTAREAAAKFDSEELGRVLVSFIPLIGLAAAFSDAEKSQKIVNDLIANCGDETFIPFFVAEANDGDEDAQAWLGQAYARGVYGKQDLEQAAQWYQKAADQGQIAALVNLGGMYRQGRGVPRDDARAEALWREASQSSSTGANSARYNLADLYIAQGKFEQARKLLLEAAKRGHPRAQFTLGSMYADAQGVERNEQTAYAWFSMAVENGYVGAAGRRDEMAGRLTEEQVKLLSARAHKCVASRYANCRF